MVWNNTSGGVAVCDITIVAILVVVGHGVIAISIWCAVWVFVATSIGSGVIGSTSIGGRGIGSVVPAAVCVACIIDVWNNS